jgi:hypothetical protein
VAYTTGDPARWSEGKGLLVSWHGYRHEAAIATPELCLPCANGEPVRKAPTRRAELCDELARNGVRLEGAEWNTDAALEDAFQRWIRAGRPHLVLVSVGEGPLNEGATGHPPAQVARGNKAPLERSPEAASALERFEELAAAFHRDTGLLAPGKDQPAAMGGHPTDEERMAAWTAWLRKRAAAAPRPPPKPKGQLSLL